ncbi:MAG: O-antigen ligase family protein [Candidatus Andersenbacteria bacterium]
MAYAAIFTQGVAAMVAAGALGSGLAWFIRFPQLPLLLLLLSLVTGQVVRVVLPGQGGGLLVSDGAVLLLLVTTYYRLLLSQRWTVVSQRLLWLLLPFIGWSLYTLLLNPLGLAGTESLVALAYWIRLTLYLLLLPALVQLIQQRSGYRLLARGFLASLTLLAFLGILQVWLWPNVSVWPGAWDPHEGRLVSTWLDPNFMGGLFVISLPWLVTFYWHYFTTTHSRVGVLTVAGVLCAALVATQSRSAVVALVVGVLVSSPLYLAYGMRQRSIRRLVATVSLVVILVVSMAIGARWLRDRLGGIIMYDPTVEVRLQALPLVWEVASAHSVTGVGYNAYQFAAREAGLIGSFTIHSRAGADNSLLTLWVATGIPGVLLFVWPWLVIVGQQLRRFITHDFLPALGLITSLLVWLLHAQFVNSLLYAHLLLAVVILTALTVVTPSDAV